MALFCSSCAIILLFLCLVLALQEMSAFPADINVRVVYTPTSYTPTSRQDAEYITYLDYTDASLPGFDNFSVDSLCRKCNGNDLCNCEGVYYCMSQYDCNLVHGEFCDCSQYGNRCSHLTEFCTENHHCCEPSKNKCSMKNQCCKRIKAECLHNYECCTSACYNEKCCKPTGGRCRFNDQCCSQNCEQAIGAHYGLCGQSALPLPTCARVGDHCSMDTPCCDTESRCTKKTSICCKVNGAFCDLSGQCCGNNACHLGKCCKTQNMKCSRNEQCCSGYYCFKNGFGENGFCTVYPIYYDLPLYGNQFRQLQPLTDKGIVAAADEDVEDINHETSSSA